MTAESEEERGVLPHWTRLVAVLLGLAALVAIPLGRSLTGPDGGTSVEAQGVRQEARRSDGLGGDQEVESVPDGAFVAPATAAVAAGRRGVVGSGLAAVGSRVASAAGFGPVGVAGSGLLSTTGAALAASAAGVDGVAGTGPASAGAEGSSRRGGPVTGTVVSDAAQLGTALATARPGDTILLRGGTYRGRWYLRQSGAPGRPITVRSYPGEWAVLDGNGPNPDDLVEVVHAGGSHWHIGQLEITDTTSNIGARGLGITIWGSGIITRHLVIHDTLTGMGLWKESGASEHYGNLIYNAGNNNLHHSIYTTNEGTGGRKDILHNILLNPSAYNLHAYHTKDPVRSYRVEGLITTGGGALQGLSRPNIIFGVEPGNSHRVHDVQLERNYVYAAPDRADGVQLDYGGLSGHSDLTMADNVWWLPRPPRPAGWSNVVDRSNQAALRNRGQSLDRVVVERVDRYEAGRGHVVVFNGRRAPSVSADLSRLLRRGQRFSIWNAANVPAGPVVTGQYDGGAVAIPMDRASLRPASPLGRREPPSTAPEFGAFIVRADTTDWTSPR